MSWFPVDDALHSHPKARKCGDEALGFWARAGSFCMAYLTDGFVPDWWVKEQVKGAAKAARLVSAGLWNRGEKDGEQGFWFHDWKTECTKGYVLAVREKARQRKAKQRESQRDTHVTDAVSPACVPPTTQPNPTHINTSPLKSASTVALGRGSGGREHNAPKRGTRLPDDWRPPDAVVRDMHQQFPLVDLLAETAKFCDYWRAKTERATKLDWPATWRNWIRRAAEARGSPNNNHHLQGADLKAAEYQALKKEFQEETPWSQPTISSTLSLNPPPTTPSTAPNRRS